MRPSTPYKIVGRTSDGVKIIAPKTKATHFTSREIRSTISEVRDRKSSVGAALSQEKRGDRSDRKR